MATLPAHVYRLDRIVAVAGLSWDTLERLDYSARLKDLKSKAKKANKRFGLIHETPDKNEKATGLRSIGALLEDGRVEKANQAVSAAVLLAEARKSERLCFVDEVAAGRYWVVAVSRGAIETRSDKILDGREARELIEGLIADTFHTDDPHTLYTRWDTPLTSNFLSRVPFQAQSFSDLVAGVTPKAEWKLRQLNGVTPVQAFAFFAFIATMVIGGGVYLFISRLAEERRLEKEREEARLMQINSERMKTLAEVRIAEAVTAAVGEDTMTPGPDAIIRACVDGYQRMGTRLGGWQLESASCEPNGSGLNFSYVMVGTLSTNRDIDAHARALGLQVSIDMQGGHATVHVPLTPPSPRDPLRPEQLPLWHAVQIELPTRLQLLRRGGAVSMAAVSPPVERAVSYRDPAKENAEMKFSPVPPDRSFRKGTLTLGAGSIWSLPRFSLEYPFVTVTKLELRPQGTAVQWTLEATYVVGNS